MVLFTFFGSIFIAVVVAILFERWGVTRNGYPMSILIALGAVVVLFFLRSLFHLRIVVTQTILNNDIVQGQRLERVALEAERVAQHVGAGHLGLVGAFGQRSRSGLQVDLVDLDPLAV